MTLKIQIINALENSTITKQGYTFHIHNYDWTTMEFQTSKILSSTESVVANIGLEEMLELLSIERDTDGTV